MSAFLVQHRNTSNGSSSASISQTFLSVPVQNNTVLAFISNGLGKTVSAVTLTNSSAFTKLGSVLNGVLDFECWGAIAGASSGSILAATFSAAATNRVIAIMEFSGLLASLTQDGAAVSNSGTSNSPATGAYSTAVAGDLVLVAASWAFGTGVATDPSSPYSSIDTAATQHVFANLAAASGSQTTASWTLSGSAAWCTLILGLEAAPGGLLLQSLLNGVTTGGPFFADPLS